MAPLNLLECILILVCVVITCTKYVLFCDTVENVHVHVCFYHSALVDHSDEGSPHVIDGILLTKFDTIDDKVHDHVCACTGYVAFPDTQLQMYMYKQVWPLATLALLRALGPAARSVIIC